MRESNVQLLVPILLTIASCSGENAPFSPHSSAIVVPIRMVEVSPLVEVKINGMPVDVLFDLGNGGSLELFPSKLNEVHGKTRVATSGGGVAMEGPFGGGRPIYQVDLVQIGDFSVRGARIGEDFHDQDFQERFASGHDAYGFLGRGYFDEQRILVDYPQRKLTIIPPDAPADQQAACSGTELRLVEGTNWGLVSTAVTEIGEIVLVWDTGSPANVVFKKRTDVDDLGFSEGDTLALDQFKINGHDFGPATFEIWDWGADRPPFDGFIGYDFFLTHVVCIDFPENRIFVQK